MAEEELGEYDPGNGGDYFEDAQGQFMGENMIDYDYLNEDINVNFFRKFYFKIFL